METAGTDREAVRSERLIARSTVAFILLFWTAQFTLLTVQRLVYMPDEPLTFLLPRFCVALVGVALSFAIVALHRRFQGKSVPRRLIAAIAAALACTLVHAASNYAIFQIFLPMRNGGSIVETYVLSMFQWFWSYAAVSGVLMSLAYSAELADRERSLARLGEIAHSAQIRALRYQLNPHFMFNTLNSIAALILRRDADTAEGMVENLAEFLRAGLALDPFEDISLAREIELQSLYLAIETLRFPDRLAVVIDVAEDAADACIPSLMCQPLVENVVRHAVAHSTTAVTLTILARVDNGQLRLSVSNTAPSGTGRAGSGTGVGLRNVAERLQQRFGAASSLVTATRADGGFVVTLSIPYESASQRAGDGPRCA